MGIGFFSGGKKRPGRDADPSPPYSAVGHERVEVYLYSRYEPYGLYRASVPYFTLYEHIDMRHLTTGIHSEKCIVVRTS